MKILYHPQLTASQFAVETTRKPGWIYDSLCASPIERTELFAAKPCLEEELFAIHEREYVEAVKTGEPRQLAHSQGFDWDEGLFPMSLAAAGTLRDAALLALQERATCSLASGFHHAKRHRGQGFCTFNGIILAARAALAAGARGVLIVDLDAHCGGGTHSYLQGEEKIRLLDLSVSPVDGYRASGHNRVVLVRESSRYLDSLSSLLRDADDWVFDLCIYNAGVDVFEGCDTGGLPGINEEMMRARDTLLASWCAKRGASITTALAGGYLGPTFSQEQLVRFHRTTIEVIAILQSKPG
jgi:acetoin utilization deacetylase AcuC-like enzyme